MTEACQWDLGDCERNYLRAPAPWEVYDMLLAVTATDFTYLTLATAKAPARRMPIAPVTEAEVLWSTIPASTTDVAPQQTAPDVNIDRSAPSSANVATAAVPDGSVHGSYAPFYSAAAFKAGCYDPLVAAAKATEANIAKTRALAAALEQGVPPTAESASAVGIDVSGRDAAPTTSDTASLASEQIAELYPPLSPDAPSERTRARAHPLLRRLAHSGTFAFARGNLWSNNTYEAGIPAPETDLLSEPDYCAPGCPAAWTGDGVCDSACDVEACAFDRGDCVISVTVSMANSPAAPLPLRRGSSSSSSNSRSRRLNTPEALAAEAAHLKFRAAAAEHANIVRDTHAAVAARVNKLLSKQTAMYTIIVGLIGDVRAWGARVTEENAYARFQSGINASDGLFIAQQAPMELGVFPEGYVRPPAKAATELHSHRTTGTSLGWLVSVLATSYHNRREGERHDADTATQVRCCP